MKFYSSPRKKSSTETGNFESQFPTQFAELMKLAGFEEVSDTANNNLTDKDCWNQKDLGIGVFHWSWDLEDDVEDLFIWLKAESRKIIWVAHEVNVGRIGITEAQAEKKKANRELMTQYADYIIVLNVNDYKRLHSICRGQVFMCAHYSLGTQVGDYPGLARHLPFEKLDYEKKTFCFYGSLQPHKGVEDLVTAWNVLKEHYLGWKLKVYAKSFGKCPEVVELLKSSEDGQLEWIQEGYTRLEDSLGEFAVFPYKSCNNSKIVEEVVMCGMPVFSTSLQAFVGRAVFMHVDAKTIIGQGIKLMSGSSAKKIRDVAIGKRTNQYKKDQKAKQRLLNLFSNILLGEHVTTTVRTIEDIAAEQQADIAKKAVLAKEQAAMARQAAKGATGKQSK